MTLYTHVSQNRVKTVLYLFLFGLLFLAIAWVVAIALEMPDILVIAAILVIIQGVVSYWFSDSIALAASKAQPLDAALPSAKAKRVHTLMENLVITAGLPMPRLYVIQDTALNAFATGRDAKHAAIAVTSGLVDHLDDNELSGVLAHELAHIGNEDIRLMSMVMVMAGLIALVSDLLLRNLFWGRRDREGNNGAMILVALALAILAPLAASLIQLAISRKREFMADATGVLITRYSEGLISALRKISHDTEPLEVANRGNAHLYFSNPLRKQWLAGLFATHPPIEARIAALESGSGMTASQPA